MKMTLDLPLTNWKVDEEQEANEDTKTFLSCFLKTFVVLIGYRVLSNRMPKVNYEAVCN